MAVNITANEVVDIFGYTNGYHLYGDFIVIIVENLRAEHIEKIQKSGYTIQCVMSNSANRIRVEIGGKDDKEVSS
ncbi:MAG: hypothetical protein OXC46_00820 [Thaumarchaeota archaeon]|nr:hypothetical protein [Nitrososphaerota archaeon]